MLTAAVAAAEVALGEEEAPEEGHGCEAVRMEPVP